MDGEDVERSMVHGLKEIPEKNLNKNEHVIRLPVNSSPYALKCGDGGGI